MEKLTFEQKLYVYIKLKEGIENDINSGFLYGLGGFCNRISKITSPIANLCHIYAYNPEKFELYFPELYAHKPEKKKLIGPYWFQIEDHQSRLKIINKVLEDLQS